MGSYTWLSFASRVTEADMEFPIMRLLIASDGRAWIDDIYAHIFEHFKGRWTEDDFEVVDNEARWKNRVRHARRPLKRFGYVRTVPGCPGWWELTEKGKRLQHYWD